LKEIEKKMDQGIKYEYEPCVPNCRTICGIFVMNIQDFIQEAIRKAVQRYYRENFVRSIFEDFAKSTVEKVIEEVVGPLEESKN
jgi:hypothetical protein